MREDAWETTSPTDNTLTSSTHGERHAAYTDLASARHYTLDTNPSGQASHRTAAAERGTRPPAQPPTERAQRFTRATERSEGGSPTVRNVTRARGTKSSNKKEMR